MDECTEVINQKDELFNAIHTQDYDTLKKLLDTGINPNSVNSHGTFALAYAVIKNNKESVIELLQQGANPHLKNEQGYSSIDLAEQHSKNIQLLQLLRADSNDKNVPFHKNSRFLFENEMNTREAHLNHSEYPRNHHFEQQYLSETIDLINEDLNEHYKRLHSNDFGGGEAYSNGILNTEASKKIPLLEELTYQPYFARVDIQNRNGENESFYIGKSQMKDDRVYSNKSSLGEIFYKKQLGALYHEELGDITVKLIRQIDNANGEIFDIYDLPWEKVTTGIDPILNKCLSESGRAQLNEIWQTIQAEQDKIIRESVETPIFVQGSAGSGKTVVALHRIAYILHKFEQASELKKIMIFGPSKLFLGYIRHVLPQLNVYDIEQNTFEGYCLQRLPFKEYNMNLLADYETAKQGTKSLYQEARMKGSLRYQEALHAFLQDVEPFIIPKQGLQIETVAGLFIVSNEEMTNQFKEDTVSKSIREKKQRVMVNIKAEVDRFIEKATREQRLEKVDEVRETLLQGVNQFDVSWKIPSVFKIYHAFSTNDDYLEKAGIQHVKLFARQNERHYENKQVTFDDLPSLLYIHDWLTAELGPLHKSMISKEQYDYLIIDEVQDYSPFQLFMINRIVKDSRFTALGDLGQSIHAYRGINSWNDIFNAFELNGEETFNYIDLHTVYRSTVEIVKFANELITPYSDEQYTLSIPVGREGQSPELFEWKDSKHKINTIIDRVNHCKEQGHGNIAIITKNWEEANTLYEKLTTSLKEIELIEDHSKEYIGGVCIIPVYLAKGLEFDVVILSDASFETYSDDEHSRKLLYVAVTRALHQLFVLYHEEVAIPILKIIDPERANQVCRDLEIKEIRKRLYTEKEELLSTFNHEVEELFTTYETEILILKEKLYALELELEEQKRQKTK